MNAREVAISIIKSFETCHEMLPDGRVKAYKCPAGVWTIGWGTTVYSNGQKVGPRDIITMEKAEAEFLFNLSLFEKDVRSLVTNPHINDNQLGALISFAYNVGSDIDIDTVPEGLGDSSLLKKVNANPNDPTISGEFNKWCKAWVKQPDGTRKLEELPGLIRRRSAESKIYFSSVN